MQDSEASDFYPSKTTSLQGRTSLSPEKSNAFSITREINENEEPDFGYVSDNENDGRNFVQRFVDGFKPAPVEPLDPSVSRYQRAIRTSTHLRLKRALTSRNINFIAIGGSLGAGIFIASGNALKTGGAAGMLIGYALIGLLLLMTMAALSEMGVRYRTAFTSFGYRFLDSSYGFAVSWDYALAWLLSLPTELTAAALCIEYWKDDDNGAVNVSLAAWVGFFYGVVLFINLFGVRGYGEAEYVLSLIKILTIVGFIVFGVVIAAGGGPTHEYIGARYWHNPGAFAHGVKGVFTVCVSASYAYTGSEFVGLAAVETDNPHRALPKASRLVFLRIILFYLLSITMIGFLVPYTHERLGTAKNGSASPFVIAIDNAGVGGLPSVVNVVIILAVLSVGNAATFGASRTVVNLAAQGLAPRFFLYIDRQGRPLAALALSFAFALIGFVVVHPNYGEAFSWLSNTGALGGLFTWMMILASHIRHRLALKHNNVPLSELVYRSPYGLWGSVLGLGIAFAVLGLMIWVAIFPIGSSADAKNFFKTFLSFFIMLALYLGHKLWYRDRFIKISEIDITTDIFNPDRRVIEEEDRAIAAKPFFKRVWNYWC